MPATDDWYKDAVIYELHVRAFADGNDDGKGDFVGLLERLPYLHELGVTCIWLLPFYPSPLKDDGYDIADYSEIHPDYGTMADFGKFLEEAHKLGMKVLTELVVNHTSDAHPWFQRARQAPKGSSDRDWYVWSDSAERWSEARIIFTDTEKSNWSWDPVAGQYYWHRFFSHQPDLNFDHPPVRKAIEKVMRFWLDMGVDGMRLDAIPYLFERDGTDCENLPETHEYIRHLRRVMDEYEPRRLFLAEANQWPEDVRAYFGDGDECHMAYHFPLMPRLFMALAQEDRHPIVDIMRRTPGIPEASQWALFLRNHDELTLEMVTDKERDYMLRAYAANPRMRINVGIRRRLSPLLENSRPRIELLTSILLSMPGTPVLYYGDEIGMGDNIYLGDRNGVRTPMQWSADRNAGFSRCDFSRLYAPPVQDPIYHYAAVNVEAQERAPSSLLVWTRRMLKLRGTSSTFGRGSIEFLEPSNRRILAYLRRHGDEQILVVANLSRHPQPVSLDLSAFHGMVPVEMQGGIPFPQIGRAPWPLSLGPWGWMWFRLLPSEAPAMCSLSEIVLLEQEEPGPWWEDRSTRIQFLSSLLPGWLPGCSWIRALGAGTMETQGEIQLVPISDSLVLAEFSVRFSDGQTRTLRVPFGTVSEEEAEGILARVPHAGLCRIRDGAGTVTVVVEALTSTTGVIDFENALRQDSNRALETALDQAHPDILASGVSVLGRHHIVGLPSGLILKWYHAASSSVDRSVRILTRLRESGFSGAPHLVGTIRTRSSGELCGVLLECIEHQGRLDERMRHELGVFLETVGKGTLSPKDAVLPCVDLVQELARSVSDLHLHLGASEPWDAGRRSFYMGSLRDLFQRVSRLQAKGRDAQRRLQDLLWKRATDLHARIGLEEWKGEAHGDLHLGQVLLREDRMVFLDFDGNAVDGECLLPEAFDLACGIWSLHRISLQGDPDPSQGFWWQSVVHAFLEGATISKEMMELMLLRRWAEEICSQAEPVDAVFSLLTGSDSWAVPSFAATSRRS